MPPLQQLQIGTLAQLRSPAYLPYHAQQPWLIQHDLERHALAAELMEGVALQLLQQHSVGIARVILFEATPSPQLAQLKRLLAASDLRWGEQIYNAEEFVKRLIQWEELIHRRFALLAQTGSPDIYDYNNKAAYAEPIIYVFLSGLGALLSDPNRLSLLKTLCDQGASVGIVPLVLHNLEEQTLALHPQDMRHQSLDVFWQGVKARSMGLQLTSTVQPIGVETNLWALLQRFELKLGLGTFNSVAVNALLQQLKVRDQTHDKQDFLTIRIGLIGNNPAYFSMGTRSLAYHAMLAGMNGSGKTTLFHQLILGACENYSPDELQITLMDFKSGVSFKGYEGIQHIAKIYALKKPNYAQSLAAVEQIIALIEDRYGLFHDHNVDNIDDYNKVAAVKLPRHVLIIDEVHKPIKEDKDWQRAQVFKKQLASIVRQGRAAGVHLIVCTQSYHGLGFDEVMAEVRLRVGLRLADMNHCAELMGLGHTNLAMMTVPDFHAVCNVQAGDPQHNRIVALDGLSKELLEARLQALKQRYPSTHSVEVEFTNPVAAADIPDWLNGG